MTDSFEPLRPFEIQVWLEARIGPIDLSLSNATLTLLLVSLLSSLLLALAMRRPQLIPDKIQFAVETYYLFIHRLTTENIREGEQFVPLIFTLFTFILGCNLIGMLPGMFTPTSQIVVTGTLALMVFTYSILLRIRRHGWGIFRTFAPPGLPGWLLPLMVPIELLSFLARPVSLAVRLFANMTAGHTVLGVIAFFGLLAPWFIQWVPMGLSVALYGVEIFIAVIQAYIFSVLSCVYIDDAM